MKRIVVQVDDQFHAEAKISAIQQGLPLKDYVVGLIKKDIKERSEKSAGSSKCE